VGTPEVDSSESYSSGEDSNTLDKFMAKFLVVVNEPRNQYTTVAHRNKLDICKSVLLEKTLVYEGISLLLVAKIGRCRVTRKQGDK
jgi:hypothetical protein